MKRRTHVELEYEDNDKEHVAVTVPLAGLSLHFLQYDNGVEYCDAWLFGTRLGKVSDSCATYLKLECGEGYDDNRND